MDWSLKLVLGSGFISIVTPMFEVAQAQSLDEAILAAITRTSPNGGFSPSYCAGFGPQSLIDLEADPSADLFAIRSQFGPNLQRICAPFGNTIGGSSLGSGNIYSLTSSRTVSQRKARALRQEQSVLSAADRRKRDQKSSGTSTSIRPYYQLASLSGGLLGLNLNQGEIAQDNFAFDAWAEVDYDAHERVSSDFTNGYEAVSQTGRAGMGMHYAPWDFGLSIEATSGNVEGDFDLSGNVISQDTLLDAFGRDIRIGLPSATADAQFEALPTGPFGDVCLISEDTSFKVNEAGAAISIIKGFGGLELGADIGFSDYDSSYDRTSCVVRAEGDTAPQVTYHGARIGGVAEVREQHVELSLSKPLHFENFVVTPRISTRYMESRYPEYEEFGQQGVFRRVTASTGPRADDGSAELQVTDQQSFFSASGLELIFLEHTTEAWISSAGMSGVWQSPTSWGDVSFHGNANYNVSEGDAQSRRLFRFKEDSRPDPTSFAFQIDPPERDWVEYNFGLSFGFNSGVRPFLSVSGIALHDYSSGWGATAGITKSF